MFTIKHLLIFALTISMGYSQQVTSGCGTVAECYTLAVGTQTALLLADRAKLLEFIKAEQNEIDKKKAAITLLVTQIEQESADINTKNLALSARERELDNSLAELDMRTALILKNHEDFKVQFTNISSLNLEQRKRKLDNLYLPEDAIIHHSIEAAFTAGVIKRSGNGGWDQSSFTEKNKWNGRSMVNIGIGAQSGNNGLQVEVPAGKNVLWLRCSNHVWGRFLVRYLVAGQVKDLGQFTCGYRTLNEYAPDGGATDTYHRVHMWIDIALQASGTHFIVPQANSDSWISGVAFSNNLWGHAHNSAVAYHWAINGGTASGWNTHDWNSDNLGMIIANQVSTMYVPVSDNKQDKLVYIVEHNNNWIGIMHGQVKVNGKVIERFRTGYNNPWAVHFNSKFFDRYIAARVPKEYIPDGSTFIKLEIDMTLSDNHIHFRSIGTHDFPDC